MKSVVKVKNEALTYYVSNNIIFNIINEELDVHDVVIFEDDDSRYYGAVEYVVSFDESDGTYKSMKRKVIADFAYRIMMEW